MPRTPASGADAELIQALADRGVTVTVSQLERWRTAGSLPRHPRTGLGRGRGTRARLLPATLARAEALARTSRQGRTPASALVGPLAQSMDGSSPGALRHAVTGALRRAVADFAPSGAGHPPGAALSSEEADDARAEALLATAGRRAESVAGRLPDTHAVLLDLAADENLDFHDIPRMPRWKRPGPLMAAGLRLFAGGPDAVGQDEIAESLGLALGLSEDETDTMKQLVAARESQALLRGDSPWPSVVFDAESMIAAVEAASDEELLRTARTTLHATALQSFAILGSILGIASQEDIPLRMEPEAVRRMLQHPVWWAWGQFVAVGGVTREEDLAVKIAMALPPGPADTDALESYATFLRAALGLPDEPTTTGPTPTP
ncbi:hypothetical protein [Kitasatospora sp. NPDC088346]|uniref:hypothetical protein n=1 Tax=Kitasatospora sp. NPDC088346 TaxID=3364073 RepID=UPI00382313D4